MGGVFGHMSHIYDNPNMTFGQIKDIMIKAADGKLENVTEKTDGQNLFVSYNVQDGTVRAARNKSNLKSGGMDAEELAEKFAGRGALTEAFTTAFRAFDLAVQQFSDKEKLELFGPDTNIFYNAEVMDPANANVINYDTKTFLIHRAGHAEFDRETGKPVDRDKGFSEQQAAKLQAALERAQDQMEKSDFKVQVNAIRKDLEPLSNGSILERGLQGVNKAMTDATMKDDDTIADYIFAQWKGLVNATIPELTDVQEKLIIDRVMTDYYGALEGQGALRSRGLETRQITKAIGRPDLNETIVSLIKNYPNYFKEFIFPLEKVIHRFAIEVLRAVKSAYIIAAGGNEKEVSRLQALVGKAIETIKSSGNEEAMEIIKNQVEKLSQLEDSGSIGNVDLSMISSAAEGIVFDYDGHTYKFTGGFAPANQILGLFKYGRKGIPAFADDLDEGFLEKAKEIVQAPIKFAKALPKAKKMITDFPLKEASRETIAAVAGGFKPPHRGHLEMIKHYADMADRVKLFIGKSPRPIQGDASGRSITAEQSLAIWERYLADAGLRDRVEVEIVSGSPMKASYSVLEDSQPGETILMGCGAKDTYFTPEALAKYTPEGVEAHAAPCPNIVDQNTNKPYSATEVRATIRDNDPAAFAKFLPPTSLKHTEEIFSILQGNIQEMSAMGGGAVAGYAGRGPDIAGSEKKKKKHPKNFLEEEEMVTEVMDYLLGISVG